LNQYLAINRLPFVLVYFKAQWNPNCKITDEHINEIAKKFRKIEVIQINSDLSPNIARHYHVRAEPEFILCRNGDEFIRQTGPNKEGL